MRVSSTRLAVAIWLGGCAALYAFIAPPPAGHQIDFAKEYAERIVALSQGKLVFNGPPSALTDDIIDRIYGARIADGERG